ncbi:MAG: hypothetical protein M3161_06270, partial [Actinomycetota bacterium]|nr:hypothetical protein [Actinomycetota bacterium]
MGGSRMIQRARTVAIGGVALALLFVTVPSTALPAPGSLDPSFDGDGRVVTVPPDQWGYLPRAMTIDDAGGIIVTGATLNLETQDEDIFLARYRPDGVLDDSFGSSGIVTADLGGDEGTFDVEVDPAGRIVVAGNSWTAGAFSAVVARFTSSGAPDVTFASEGFLTTRFDGAQASASALEVLDTTQIIVAVGIWTTQEYDSRHSTIVRLNENGSLDPTFGDGGVGELAPPNFGIADIAIDDQQRIVAGGSTTSGHTDIVVLRYSATGTIDRAFGTDGWTRVDFADQSDYFSEIAIDGEGRIVGSAYVATGFPTSDDLGAIRLLPDGSRDRSFSDDGKVAIDFGTQSDVGSGLALDRNDELIVVGSTPHNAVEREPNDFAVARIAADGSIDRTFSGDGKVRTDFAGGWDSAFDAEIDADGNVVVTGLTRPPRSGYQFAGLIAIARYIGGPYGRDPRLAINDVGVKEGDRGRKTVHFEISLDEPPTTAVSVSVRGEFYASERDTNRVREELHFEPGETLKRVPVYVYGDLQRGEGIERYT